MIKIIRQLFCIHDYQKYGSPFKKEIAYDPYYTSNFKYTEKQHYICTKCGKAIVKDI